MLTNQKPLHDILRGETYSLYIDGKPDNVNWSVLQEQNKQIKNSTSQQAVQFFAALAWRPPISPDTQILRVPLQADSATEATPHLSWGKAVY